MGSAEWVAIGLFVLTVIFSIFGWILRSTVDRMGLEIERNRNKIVDLELKVAETHHSKTEIDGIFENFKTYMNERFDRIEKAIGFGQKLRRDDYP